LVSRQGLAQLIEDAPFAWVEITDRKNRVADGPWALGRRLWSPSAALGNGADVYAFMRHPSAGDLVLHFVDEGAPSGRMLVGLSRVAAGYRETSEVPPRAGKWEGASAFYIVDLEGYESLDVPLAIQHFIAEHSTEITARDVGEGNYPFATRRDGVRPQLQYLTRAPRPLLLLLSKVLKGEAVAGKEDGGEDPIWLRGEHGLGLADILNEKFTVHFRSTGYLARLTAWFDRHRASLGEGDPVALVLASGGFTGRIGSVKPNHGRLIWLLRDDDMGDPQARRAMIDAFDERSNLRTVISVRPDPSAPGGLLISDWGMRRPDPLIERLVAEGVRFAPIDPYIAPPTIETAAATGASSRDEGLLDDLDWSEVTLEDVMSKARIDGAEEAVLRALAALASGMNVIFVGPPGTGKTSLASAIFEAAGVGYDLRCASDHWTTYDTIGGYFPEPDDEGRAKLVFRPGALLQSIQAGRCTIVDEINRADIDKAFGELFTLFGSKQAVELRLPLKAPDEDGVLHDVVLAKAGVRGALETAPSTHRIEASASWRMIGSMNDADRASLKRFSLAFARRFAMVPVRLPEPGRYRELVRRQIEAEGERLGGLEALKTERLAALAEAVFVASTGLLAMEMPLGPGFAITVVDQAMAELVRSPTRSAERSFLSALELYIAPQFQGLATKHHEFVEMVATVTGLAPEELVEFEQALAAWTGGAVAF
jgi:hypothetical protein